MTFTAEEIKQAQESPRVGDVWKGGRVTYCLTSLDGELVGYDFSVNGYAHPGYCERGLFIDWTHTRNATLINRGPA